MSNMDKMNMNKLTEDDLNQVAGGAKGDSVGVRDVSPYWVKVTAPNGLNCRTAPNGKVIKKYAYGRELRINGITTDNEWYRLTINHPEGGTFYGFIAREYTERIK